LCFVLNSHHVFFKLFVIVLCPVEQHSL
jgi:hypothetical protein